MMFQPRQLPSNSSKVVPPGTWQMMAHIMQNWLISAWPLNSPDLNPLDYHIWGVMPVKSKKAAANA